MRNIYMNYLKGIRDCDGFIWIFFPLMCSVFFKYRKGYGFRIIIKTTLIFFSLYETKMVCTDLFMVRSSWVNSFFILLLVLLYVDRVVLFMSGTWLCLQSIYRYVHDFWGIWILNIFCLMIISVCDLKTLVRGRLFGQFAADNFFY